ncbi:hypothetical protein [Erythrobacter sp. SD-21]|uniref:hypothetical protein n=1 Tax=Erythrobacter sp. SD-21 TaxID=161528 RepID=UPI000153EE79|nr:hypothetical protein [Erythrobacter sp. SD-21]EDL48899.1 hypothetical protein ED21_24251 [Erythrobacter sp. SD-21]
MGFSNFDRGIFGGKVFGKKTIAGAAPQRRAGLRTRSEGNALDRLVADAESLARRQKTNRRYKRQGSSARALCCDVASMRPSMPSGGPSIGPAAVLAKAALSARA